jgi:hypothetical protein
MTNLDFKALKEQYFFDGSNFKQNTGKPGPKSDVSYDTVAMAFLKINRNLTLEDADKLRPVIEDALKIKTKNSISITTQELIDKVKQSGLFKEFYVIKPSLDAPWTLFRKKHKILAAVGALDKIKPEDFFGYIKGLVDDSLGREIQNLLTPYVFDPKKNPNPTMEDCIKFLLREVLISELINDSNKIDHNTVVYPAAIESMGLMAYYDIPFTHKHTEFSELNIYLQDLLTRINNHPYLCATIWSAFIGKPLPYLVYLVGPGGDGKSAFIKMLIQIVNGSVAVFNNKGDFGGGEMFGKAIIHVTENTNPYLLNDSTVKSMTGGNNIRVNNKGLKAYSAVFKSLLIADSNNDLEIGGEKNETRRLMYHRVSPPNISEEQTIMPDYYKELISSTQNEFLNYCRQCYEVLKTTNGGIATPNNFNDIIESLKNSSSALLFESFIKAYGYEEDSELSCSQAQVFLDVKQKLGKTIPFVEKNFRIYITSTREWKIENGRIVGWGPVVEVPEPTDKTGFPE